jgi:hypothetical protein
LRERRKSKRERYGEEIIVGERGRREERRKGREGREAKKRERGLKEMVYHNELVRLHDTKGFLVAL